MKYGQLLAFGAVIVSASGFARAETLGSAITNYQPGLALTEMLSFTGLYPDTVDSALGALPSNTLGMVRTFAGNYSIGNSPTLNGQAVATAAASGLGAVLGTTYGGNGATTFGLPDLGGRAVVGVGSAPHLSTYGLGQRDGVTATFLTDANLPSGTPSASGGVTGSNRPFDGREPTLALNYEIAASGYYNNAGSDPVVGELVQYAGQGTVEGFLNADGSLLNISDYALLFSVIGSTYGGDGVTTFALPDLRGRVAVGVGAGVALGQAFGSETTTLTTANIPTATKPGAPFDNAQPSLGINYIIALDGVFPSRYGSGIPDDTPFFGEVKAYAGTVAPSGWAFADGSLQMVYQNQALFSILGTRFGGDGQTTFALPDLRGRTVLGSADFLPVGASTGERYTTLVAENLPVDPPTGAVPEPATWAVMLLGFGLVGRQLRRRFALPV